MTAIDERPAVGYRHLVQDAPRDFRVHTSLYTDPAIFAAEMERIFERGWVYVGHTSEVAAPGTYKTTHMGRQPVIVTRDDVGTIHVLLNVCRHRGAAVCRDAAGQATTFQCPYHGWVYSNSGKLLGISSRDGYPEEFGRDIEGLLRAPRVAECRGLIFASLSAAGESLEQHLGAAKEYIDLWADASPTGQVRVRAPHRYAYTGNWKFQIENTNDGYHPRFVHESAFRARAHFTGRSPRQAASSQDSGCTIGFAGGHSVLEWPDLDDSIVTKVAPAVAKDYVGRLERQHGADWTQRALIRRHVVILPNVVLMDMNIRVIQPVAVDRTEVYSHYVALDDVPDAVNRVRLRDVQARLGTAGMINTDDLEVFAACQTGVQTPGMDWVLLSRGLHRELVGPDGKRVGAYTDETPQRALYRGWLRLMEG